MKNKSNFLIAGILTSPTASNNVLVVDVDGLPTWTQVWDGGSKAAAETVLKWVAAGLDKENNLDKNNNWDKEKVHAYIKSHGKVEETRFYDLNNPAHLADLKAMAFA